jgi:diadenosine tetraphosphate (Ap4A) HIT family hydrolase
LSIINQTETEDEVVLFYEKRRTKMTSNFPLHPQLEKDFIFVQDWPLCQLLFKNDTQFPWLILIPKRLDLTEIHDLSSTDQIQLIQEISKASLLMKKIFNAHKINIGALGNMVPQLHIHVIARFEDDEAWPHAVWGHTANVPYKREYIEDILDQLKTSLVF